MRSQSEHAGQRIRMGLAVTLAGVVAAISSLPEGQGAVAQAPRPGVTMKAIKEAYQKRQDRVRSARFVWKSDYTERRGSVSETLNRLDPKGMDGVGTAIMPAKDTTVQRESSVELDGENIRYQWEGPCFFPFPNVAAYVKMNEVSTYYKGVCKSCTIKDHAVSHYPQCQVRRGSSFDLGGSEVRMLTFLFREKSPNLSPHSLGHFKVSGKHQAIEGVSCAELLYEATRGRSVRRVWVAPTRDYVMTRMTEETNNRVTFQITVQYREDPQDGWIPSSWQVIENNPEGRLLNSTVSTVTDARINHYVQADTLDLVFPPGSSVSDDRAGQSYVIKPSGEKRLILRKEYGATFEQLISSNTGEAFASSEKPKTSTLRKLFIPLMLILAVVALLVYVSWRSWRQWSSAKEAD